MAKQASRDQASDRTESMMDEVSTETKRLIEVQLNVLLEAEGNFIGLYDAVIDRMKAKDAKEKLTEFRGDHERRVQELRGMVEAIDGDLIVQEATPTPLGVGLAQRLEDVEDEKLLIAEFLVGEDLSRRTYQMASAMEAPERVARVLMKAVEDEERHYRWAARFSGIDPDPL